MEKFLILKICACWFLDELSLHKLKKFLNNSLKQWRKTSAGYSELMSNCLNTCICHLRNVKTSIFRRSKNVKNLFQPYSIAYKREPSRLTSFIKQPHTENDLKEIVEDENFSELEGFSVFHEFGSEYLREKLNSLKILFRFQSQLTFTI